MSTVPNYMAALLATRGSGGAERVLSRTDVIEQIIVERNKKINVFCGNVQPNEMLGIFEPLKKRVKSGI